MTAALKHLKFNLKKQFKNGFHVFIIEQNINFFWSLKLLRTYTYNNLEDTGEKL